MLWRPLQRGLALDPQANTPAQTSRQPTLQWGACHQGSLQHPLALARTSSPFSQALHTKFLQVLTLPVSPFPLSSSGDAQWTACPCFSLSVLLARMRCTLAAVRQTLLSLQLSPTITLFSTFQFSHEHIWSQVQVQDTENIRALAMDKVCGRMTPSTVPPPPPPNPTIVDQTFLGLGMTQGCRVLNADALTRSNSKPGGFRVGSDACAAPLDQMYLYRYTLACSYHIGISFVTLQLHPPALLTAAIVSVACMADLEEWSSRLAILDWSCIAWSELRLGVKSSGMQALAHLTAHVNQGITAHGRKEKRSF